VPEPGTSAVVLPVPEAEPAVSAWRARFDASAAMGMPAHVTALLPFLDEARLTADITQRLAALCERHPVLDVEFARFGRFPGVLYLDPEPPDGLRRLTLAIAEEWPEAPPYGGAFDKVVPHLTVAEGADAETEARIEADVRAGLPVRARLAEAVLVVFDGTRWAPRLRLPFGA
jgi:2'-5' RNA ligase